ncbi:MAG: hypothetical protein OJJ21_00730 [Ferrovibrio sp.]|uniref:hypothetical protein n=1 Tax=Ferrovibrio sp. TaxID=1917215 RepID=UPI002637E3E8|nr:hypothetical protein [Ferrovibrio sp.]MCW0232102.1 hypothetical protein [Ferrovibrio sp.]
MACPASRTFSWKTKLANYFELLVNVYEPSEDGKSLVEWMKDDWQLFSHQRMDVAHAKELLGEILDDGEIVRRGFAPSESYISEGLAQWDKLRDEMMYSNRWFLNVAIDLDRLRQLLDMLLALPLPRRWYRARIRTEDGVFPIRPRPRSGRIPAKWLALRISRSPRSRPWTFAIRASWYPPSS